jgi:hypothetical protein
MDTSKVKRWITTCNTEHGIHCQTNYSSVARPLWLIDLRDNCLKPAYQFRRYLALSYVWGTPKDDTPTLDTTEENLLELQEDGAFDREDVASRIPRTIKDVFRLVRLLGERYLWIDRFCIVQDSETKLAQIHTMADIYSGAYLTIIAGGGDAYHGLRGIKGATSRRSSNDIMDIPLEREGLELERTVYIKGVDEFNLHRDTDSINFGPISLSHMLSNSPWSKRAWTLQERIFSQRAIYVFDACVVWECHCNIWHECQGAGIISGPTAKIPKKQGYQGAFRWCPYPRSEKHDEQNVEGLQSDQLADKECLNRFSKFAKGLQYSLWPDLAEYFTFVEDYCGRKLTFAGDALAAFAGVTETLSHVFHGGFHFGLPEMFFDVSLLWLRGRHAHCTRRVVLDAKEKMNTLPSWSWMGWEFSEGTIDLTYCMTGYAFVRQSKKPTRRLKDSVPSLLYRTIPIIEWWISSPDAQKRQITSHYPRKCHTERADSVTLSQGWKRKGDHFIHKCDPLTAFDYPITIVDLSIWKHAPWEQRSPLLSFKTNGGSFKHKWRIVPEGQSTILDEKGQESGTLVWDEDCSKSYRSETVTLISIARGRGGDPLDIFGLHDLGAVPEFYYVLCVKTVDGINYRLAFGAVKRQVWELQGTEKVDVLLG